MWYRAHALCPKMERVELGKDPNIVCEKFRHRRCLYMHDRTLPTPTEVLQGRKVARRGGMWGKGRTDSVGNRARGDTKNLPQVPAMPMGIEAWRRMEELCLSAGGAEALAFKMVRDTMLSPTFGVDEGRVTSSEFEPVGSICGLPLSLPCVMGERQAELEHVSCTMRTMIDPFHKCEDFTGGTYEVDYFKGNAEGARSAVIQGRVSNAVSEIVPKGEVMGNDVFVTNLERCAGDIGLGEKSVLADPTFRQITYPAFRQELDSYKARVGSGSSF